MGGDIGDAIIAIKIAKNLKKNNELQEQQLVELKKINEKLSKFISQ